jgi:hypothetical protein
MSEINLPQIQPSAIFNLVSIFLHKKGSQKKDECERKGLKEINTTIKEA